MMRLNYSFRIRGKIRRRVEAKSWREKTPHAFIFTHERTEPFCFFFILYDVFLENIQNYKKKKWIKNSSIYSSIRVCACRYEYICYIIILTDVFDARHQRDCIVVEISYTSRDEQTNELWKTGIVNRYKHL